jgi:periplasmic copper chaperone A
VEKFWEKFIMKNGVFFSACVALAATQSVLASPLIPSDLRGARAPTILIADSSDVTAGDLTIKDAFTRPTLGGATVAVGYATIVNKGTADDRLIAVSSDLSSTSEIHESKMSNGVMEMHELAGGLPIPAGATVSLAPGSYHIMFVGIKQPVKPGDTIHAVFTFSKAGKVDVAFPAAASPGAMAPSNGGMKGMDMNGMGNMKM